MKGYRVAIDFSIFDYSFTEKKKNPSLRFALNGVQARNFAQVPLILH